MKPGKFIPTGAALCSQCSGENFRVLLSLSLAGSVNQWSWPVCDHGNRNNGRPNQLVGRLRFSSPLSHFTHKLPFLCLLSRPLSFSPLVVRHSSIAVIHKAERFVCLPFIKCLVFLSYFLPPVKYRGFCDIHSRTCIPRY